MSPEDPGSPFRQTTCKGSCAWWRAPQDTHASPSFPPARRGSPPLAAAAPTPVLIVRHSEHDYLPHFFTVWLRFFCYLLRSCSTFQPCIKIMYSKAFVIKYCLCSLRTPCPLLPAPLYKYSKYCICNATLTHPAQFFLNNKCYIKIL